MPRSSPYDRITPLIDTDSQRSTTIDSSAGDLVNVRWLNHGQGRNATKAKQGRAITVLRLRTTELFPERLLSSLPLHQHVFHGHPG